eukprot:GHVU01191813.1.p1 GENE.GHVU01191813.1~~GHVU01191813.1.p1  ORF type:complete len:168 (-),score=7.89 GHVU01191813.1:287-790(-)
MYVWARVCVRVRVCVSLCVCVCVWGRLDGRQTVCVLANPVCSLGGVNNVHQRRQRCRPPHRFSPVSVGGVATDVFWLSSSSYFLLLFLLLLFFLLLFFLLFLHLLAIVVVLHASVHACLPTDHGQRLVSFIHPLLSSLHPIIQLINYNQSLRSTSCRGVSAVPVASG